MTKPTHVHLVGSIGLDTVEDVFHTCGTLLGARLQRIPDGEPGGRRLWCSWQIPLLRANPFFKLAEGGRSGPVFGTLELADGVQPEDIRFGELGYAREARASYEDFKAAKARGDLPSDVRFQVSLPTPFAVVFGQFTPETMPGAEAAYAAAMAKEVGRICDAIPHGDLCIQWDVCFEMVMWDGSNPFWRWPLPGEGKAEILKRLAAAAAAVPHDVELGFHLCYGDLDAQHFFNPADAAAMVDLATALSAAVTRSIAYIHMPVPADRSDDGFFRPFDGLAVHPETEIFLGIVHAADGVEGVERRRAAASRHLKSFGIATECGMARARTPDLVERILEIHAAATDAPSPG
jgi:methionine synthase II (cobalamin-independent)